MSLNKLMLIFILGFVSCATPKQKQLFDYWIRIKVEKKDGSRYVERNRLAETFTALKISKNNMSTSHSELPSIEIPYYFIGDSVLKQNIDSYKVKDINDTILVLLENDNGRPDDKVNKFTFIKEKDFVKYLIKNKLMEFENDSIALLSRYFYPYYNRNWQQIINNKYNSSNLNGYISFEVLLDSIGKTKQVKLIENKNISIKIENDITNMIKKSRAWSLKQLKMKYCYKIDFTAVFVSKQDYHYAGVKLFAKNPDDNSSLGKSKQLNYSDIELSNKYFKNGVDYVNKNELEKALVSFSNCISIDSLYIDSYYNRAFVNYEMNQLKKACNDWRFLSENLGQKTAEKLFNENCKKE